MSHTNSAVVSVSHTNSAGVSVSHTNSAVVSVSHSNSTGVSVSHSNSAGVSVQVNGVNIESLRHTEVVAFIKSGGEETRLLVVDPDTDERFKKLGIVPTESHVKGTLPTTPQALSSRTVHLHPRNGAFLHGTSGISVYPASQAWGPRPRPH